MNLKPLNDRVIVKPEEAVEMSKGGIILPDTASKEKPMQGEVIAAGPGKVSKDGARVALSVKAGDKVLFSKYAGTEVKIENVTYQVMREEDILAIIK